MKTWTVMLIPDDRGSTRTLTLADWHVWAVVGLLTVLTFSTAFLYQRHRTLEANVDALRTANRALEVANAKPSAPAAPKQVAVAKALDESALRAMESRLRAEYESSLSAVTAELGALYDMEAKARDITGLAPREKSRVDELAMGDGKGGGAPGGLGITNAVNVDPAMRPPQVIYGLFRPSADLLLQEILVRRQSLDELIEDGLREQDRLARIPSIWPLAKGLGKITSRYGNRVDPFLRRVRHHSGTDIAAPRGTTVMAPARGKVVTSEFDRYLGNLVKIDHGNGIITWFAHLNKRDVKVGDKVERKDPIGQVGSTGRSTGPHLHYEVRMGDAPRNPEKYLSE